MWVFVSEIRASHGSAENLSLPAGGEGERHTSVHKRTPDKHTPTAPHGVSKRLIRSRVLCLYIYF